MTQIPSIEDFRRFIESIYKELQSYTNGYVASNIPELESANPELFGISLVDVYGHSISVGDTTAPFTLQSAVKPFTYSSTIKHLNDHEREKLIAKIGFEPTGTPYNSMIQQEDIQKGVLNPMLNAGAIITAGAIPGQSLQERWEYLLDMISRFAGKSLSLNQSALQSKRKNDHRNLALAHLMYSEGLVNGNLDDAIEIYFRQCSIEAVCNDIAVMAATLANSGTNPITGEQVLQPFMTRNILSVMYSCGLYDFSGQWAYRVGLPAKCGLSGVVFLVVPNVCGMTVFSPRLGKKMISLRGIKVCEAFSKEFGYHIFSNSSNEKPKSNPFMNVYLKNSPAKETETHQNGAPQSHHPNRKDLVNKHKNYFNFEDLSSIITKHYHKCRTIHDGVAYQSEHGLRMVNPNDFGVCAVSIHGDTFSIGDDQQSFLLQSISKIFTYGLALEDYGRNYVLSRVDVEPTGKSYDSIIRVQQRSKRPHNPMVNTGAIAITSLIQGETPAKRLTRVLEMYSRYGGRQFFVDMPTYISEQNGGYRNLSIAYLLRNFDMIEGEILQTLDLYLQQCSVLLNCHDLAVMGATLANSGVNPITKQRAIKRTYVQDILSVMFTCGMYDFTGEWIYRIGFPAKSGVSGAIVIVIPGECGIAIYSPPLDSRGNSVRGIRLSEGLFNELNLHTFDMHKPESMMS